MGGVITTLWLAAWAAERVKLPSAFCATATPATVRIAPAGAPVMDTCSILSPEWLSVTFSTKDADWFSLLLRVVGVDMVAPFDA